MITGYKLINEKTGEAVQSWGGVWGQCPAPPTVLFLPSGEHVHGAKVGERFVGYQLVEWDQEAPAPTAEAVAAEASARLSRGFDFTFPDDRGTHRIGTTARDMAGWDEVTKGALAAIFLGAGEKTFVISTDTGLTECTALEWMAIVGAATLFRQPIWAASFSLQAMTPIPTDYQNDKYWPGV